MGVLRGETFAAGAGRGVWVWGKCETCPPWPCVRTRCPELCSASCASPLRFWRTQALGGTCGRDAGHQAPAGACSWCGAQTKEGWPSWARLALRASAPAVPVPECAPPCLAKALCPSTLVAAFSRRSPPDRTFWEPGAWCHGVRGGRGLPPLNGRSEVPTSPVTP